MINQASKLSGCKTSEEKRPRGFDKVLKCVIKSLVKEHARFVYKKDRMIEKVIKSRKRAVKVGQNLPQSDHIAGILIYTGEKDCEKGNDEEGRVA